MHATVKRIHPVESDHAMSDPSVPEPSADPSGRRAGRAAVWLPLALLALAYFAPLGWRPLIIPDEARYAEIPRAMLDSGDWLALRFCELDYYEKPPLGYWLNACSIAVFGRNPFAVRFPTALAAFAAAAAVFALLRRPGEEAARPGLAAVIHLSLPLVAVMGTFAALDSMFAAFVALSMGALYRAETARDRRPRLAWSAAAGAAAGLAFLTKGFVAFVIPALTAVAWLAWEKRFRRCLTVWIVPMAAAALVCLPAGIAIHRHNPDFWRHFVFVEHIERFLRPEGGQHPEPFWYFAPVLAGGLAIWCVAIPRLFRNARARARGGDPLTRFCAGWFAASFLFFSACGGKLPSYLLPCMPPLAVMLSDAMAAPDPRKDWRRLARAAALLLLAALIGAFIWAHYLQKDRVLDWTAMPRLEAAAFAAAGLGLAACAWMAGRADNARGGVAAAAWLSAAAVPVLLAASVFFPKPVAERKSASELLAWALERLPPGALLLADRNAMPLAYWHFRPALSYAAGGRPEERYAGRTLMDRPRFLFGLGELEYGYRREMLKSPSLELALADSRAVIDRIREALRAGRPVGICVRRRDYGKLDLEASGPGAPAEFRATRGYVWALYLPPDEGPR
uniref:Polymyxin resistance protein ArnT n=1 Tax=uncultured bacterium contig00174 TaxID=1181596 RepID=A0A806K1F7_9BACT|nr:polymyxin resistance protein ArnT [uncultured bacterium contig00174]